ncbi:nucleotidyltransferase domain-containing protein [Thermomicrobium sp.]
MRFLDRESVLAALWEAAREAGRCPGVRAIYLFGSFAGGIPTPRSDADLLVVVVDGADREAARACCEEAFQNLPVPVDLFVWSEEEVAASVASGRGLAANVLPQAVRLV